MKHEIWIVDINRGDGTGWHQYITADTEKIARQRMQDERDWSKRTERKDKYRLTKYVPERKSR